MGPNYLYRETNISVLVELYDGLILIRYYNFTERVFNRHI